MSRVSQIQHDEPARLDRDRLEELVIELGEPGAERMVGRALEELAIWLNRADRAYAIGDALKVADCASDLCRISAEVGLVSLHRVARDVRHTATVGDNAALSATMARMMRIGESSLMSVWDINDMAF